MPRPGWGPSKLIVSLLVAVALASGAAASLARPAVEVALRASPASARLIAGPAGIEAVISRAADLESRAPRRGGSPYLGAVAVAIAGLAALRRRPLAVHLVWGRSSGGTGRAHDRGPPVTA